MDNLSAPGHLVASLAGTTHTQLAAFEAHKEDVMSVNSLNCSSPGYSASFGSIDSIWIGEDGEQEDKEKEKEKEKWEEKKKRKKKSKEDVIRIKVGGDVFLTYLSTLDRFPDTLLGNHEERTKHWDEESKMFIFNRNRIFFEWILHFYQSNGKLYIPKGMSADLVEKELNFFGIMRQDKTRAASSEDAVVVTGNSTQQKLFQMLTEPYSSTYAKTWALFDVTLIMVSIITFIVETEPYIVELTARDPNHYVLWIMFVSDAICVVFFTADMVMKLYSWPTKFGFFQNILNWLDFLAVAPFYVQVVTLFIDGHTQIPTLFILRIGRVVRLFKLVRRIPSIHLVLNIISGSGKELALLGVLWSITVYIAAALVFYLENMGEASEQFTTMFHSLWWSVVTMGTVGYGDLSPTQVPGKVAGTFVVFGSMIFLTLPMTVIVSRFNEVYDEERRKIAEEGFEQDGLPLRDKILLVQKSQPRRAARKEI